MRRRWLILLAVTAVAAAIAYGIAHRCVCGRAAPTPSQLGDMSFLTRELTLSAAQTTAIRGFNTALAGQLTECCARHCDARARLARTALDDTNDPARTDALLVEVSRAYADSERATLDHIRQVRTVLTAEQRRRFDTLVDTCLCRTCNMGSMPSTERTP
jgi:hypothetical protein